MDCRRTDRNQPLFSTPRSTSPVDGDNIDNEKERAKRYSTISPNMSDIGAQSPSNEHIDRLSVILLSYNFFEKELGLILTHCAVFLLNISGQAMSRACRICVHRYTW